MPKTTVKSKQQNPDRRRIHPSTARQKRVKTYLDLLGFDRVGGDDPPRGGGAVERARTVKSLRH